jgi:selenocysteine lyase/cysteine desulfurase
MHLPPIPPLAPQELAAREDFWHEIQTLYKLSPEFIQLENGFYGVLPEPLLNAHKAHVDALNAVSSLYMRRDQPQDMRRLKEQLAALAGCTPNEFAFARNATEALNVILSGIDLEPGGEILLSTFDYPSAIDACEQRRRRYGTPYRLMTEPLHGKSNAEILAYVEAQLQPQTRLLVVTHLIHYTGQILPVREITELAHAKGVEVLVDSAHAFAQLDFRFDEMGCDYWIANLHKWLYAPLTGGAIAIRKEKIHRIWPLIGDPNPPVDDIRKLERFSALPMPIFLTLFEAIEFHNLLTVKVKQARLRYLQLYWTDQIRDLPGVTVYTPREQSGALASIAVQGLTAQQLVEQLWARGIFGAVVQTGDYSAVRLTVQLHTRLSDLDTLVGAIQEIAA